MKLLIIVGLVVTFSNLFGQGTIIFEDGQRKDFTKFKESAGTLIIHNKKEKETIDINKIKGYFEEFEFIFYYKKPDEHSADNYQFIRRHLDGKINLYQKTFTRTSQYGVSSNTIYYIEKGDRFQLILETNAIGQNKKKKIDSLRSFVSDNSNIRSLITDDFKLNDENLISLIKEYNCQEYELKTQLISSNLATLIFYRVGKDIALSLVDRAKFGKFSDEDINFSIDNNSYKLSKYEWVEIKIPTANLAKIYVDTSSNCLVINPHDFFKIYIEIEQEKNTRQFIITRTDYEEGASIVSRLEDYKQTKKGK